ncbi:hypothetical protein [Sphingomonas sp. PP-F2F-A104-K0414]|uniref:hypothetical protein n=1 Tax=Sphingomonas sp. PP-F2F-A104-K0414 TaxID=2135661 RepID=UPI001053307D|nr:hypothetical protein [Sphingomonas sp. PP-F2F-A104-K0414]
MKHVIHGEAASSDAFRLQTSQPLQPCVSDLRERINRKAEFAQKTSALAIEIGESPREFQVRLAGRAAATAADAS